jgi:uncharacterized protein YjiS (DUF1127 family)
MQDKRAQSSLQRVSPALPTGWRQGMRGLLIYLGEVYRTALRRSIRWQRRYVNNRKLLALDERTLKDIGLPRSEIPFLADTLAQTETPVRQTVRDICRH